MSGFKMLGDAGMMPVFSRYAEHLKNHGNGKVCAFKGKCENKL